MVDGQPYGEDVRRILQALGERRAKCLTHETDAYRQAIVRLACDATSGKRKTMDKGVVADIAGRALDAGNAWSRRGKDEDVSVPSVSTTAGTASDLSAAVEAFVRVDFDDWPQHMTCSEVDALAAVLRAGSFNFAAEVLLANHAFGDFEEDTHYRLLGPEQAVHHQPQDRIAPGISAPEAGSDTRGPSIAGP